MNTLLLQLSTIFHALQRYEREPPTNAAAKCCGINLHKPIDQVNLKENGRRRPSPVFNRLKRQYCIKGRNSWPRYPHLSSYGTTSWRSYSILFSTTVLRHLCWCYTRNNSLDHRCMWVVLSVSFELFSLVKSIAHVRLICHISSDTFHISSSREYIGIYVTTCGRLYWCHISLIASFRKELSRGVSLVRSGELYIFKSCLLGLTTLPQSMLS